MDENLLFIFNSKRQHFYTIVFLDKKISFLEVLGETIAEEVLNNEKIEAKLKEINAKNNLL
jgi:hypothetical protein